MIRIESMEFRLPAGVRSVRTKRIRSARPGSPRSTVQAVTAANSSKGNTSQ